MSIAIHPALEAKLRARAEAAGMSIETYLESLVNTDQETVDEVESLAIEGLSSGEPIEVGAGYWEEKHRRLDERLSNSVQPIALR